MLKGTANALGSSEKCLMFRYKQTATFIHGKQKSGYRNNKSPTTGILSLVLLFFPLSQEIRTNIFAGTCAHRQWYHFFLNCCWRTFLFLMTLTVKKKKGKLYDPTWEGVVFSFHPKNLKVRTSPLESFIIILLYICITSLKNKNEVLHVIHNSSSLHVATNTGVPQPGKPTCWTWQLCVCCHGGSGHRQYPVAQESGNTLNSTTSPTASRSIKTVRRQCHQVCFINSEVLKKVERVLFKSNHSNQANSWICGVSAGLHSDTKSGVWVACRIGALIQGSTKRCCWQLLFYKSVLQRLFPKIWWVYPKWLLNSVRLHPKKSYV